MRRCIEQGCMGAAKGTRCAAHEAQRERQRGTTAQRGYGAAWQKHSRERRAEQPWCSTCGSGLDLTVDHPTDAVLCRSCHDRLEVRRRGGSKP